MKICRKIENGFEEFIISENVPSGYEDITSIENVFKVGDFLFKDYKWKRDMLKQIALTSWGGMSADDKFKVCCHKATTENNCKEVLGGSFEYYMTIFDLESQACRAKRFSMAKTILIKRLDLMSRFFVLGGLNATSHERDYIQYGIEGTTEGDPITGIFNFIEGTGSYSLSGVKNMQLTLIEGTKEEMIFLMMECLRKGNY